MKFTPASKMCSGEGCNETFTDHRWAPERAKGSGWFHQKTGESWCPQHIPEWVAGWREKREEKSASSNVYQELVQLYRDRHEERCTDVLCDCDAKAVQDARRMFSRIASEYEKNGLPQ